MAARVIVAVLAFAAIATAQEDILRLADGVVQGSFTRSALVWNARRKTRLPRLYPGNFRDGHGGVPLYNGTFFANRTKTIVIGINYRMGALGFLATGSASSDIHGNYGMRDMILALRWVQRNAQLFGGDAKRVTFSGQSAGAMAAAVMLSLPECQGLFSSVLMESEPFTLPYRDVQSMPLLANAFAKILGCPVTDAACMRAKPPKEVLDAQQKAATDSSAISHFLQAFLPWSPFVDGVWIKKQPFKAISDGEYPRGLPILLGTTRHEAYAFIWEAFKTPVTPLTADVVIVAVLGPVRAIRALEKYPIPANTTDARFQLSNIATDYIFHCPVRNITRTLARSNPVYNYIFDHNTSFGYKVYPPGHACLTHVCHGEELPYVFDSVEPYQTWNAQEAVLSRSMNNMWAGFFNNGDPNSLRRENPPWPRYQAADSQSYYFTTEGAGNRVVSNFNKDMCDFWDTQGYGF